VPTEIRESKIFNDIALLAVRVFFPCVLRCWLQFSCDNSTGLRYVLDQQKHWGCVVGVSHSWYDKPNNHLQVQTSP
jgi:hypothetical protein